MNSPEFFQRVLGRQVLVRLANGIGLTGFLEAVDGSLNVVLRDQGKIVFIRGNHVFFLTPVQDENLIRVIVKNCKITSLYGLLIFVFSLTTFLIIGGTLMLILGQICMSVFSSLTSVMGRQASVSQSTLLASRYASWSLINLIIWGGVGAYSSYIEVWILVLFTPPSVSIPVSLIWFALYLSGLLLYIRFLKVSKLYRESVVQHQLAGDNPDVPPGQRAQAYQSGYQGGLQPGYQSGYQPGYQPVQQPYPQGQAVNYFAPGSNVYYGSPMNNNPVGK